MQEEMKKDRQIMMISVETILEVKYWADKTGISMSRIYDDGARLRIAELEKIYKEGGK